MQLSNFYKKHRKSILIASTVVSIVGLAVIGLLAYKEMFLSSPINVASWYDNSWEQRKAITVSNNSGGNLTNEAVLVEMDTASLISTGKLQVDCDDLRFLDSDDSTALNYWIEGGCNTSSTQIWVKIPSLPTAGKTVYVYYGNSSAVNSEMSWTGKFITLSTVSCPTGWTRESLFDARYPYGSSSYGTRGAGTHSHNQAECDTEYMSDKVPCLSPDPDAQHPIDASATHRHTGLKVDVNSTQIIPPYIGMVYCSNSDLSTYNGSVYLDDETTYPTNTSRYTTLDGKYPRGSVNYNATGGGSDTHTHTTTGGYLTSVGLGWNKESMPGATYPKPEHQHYTANGSTAAGNNNIPYLNMIYVKATSSNVHLNTPILMTNVVPPLGWTRFSALDGKFPRGASTYGGSSAGSTHTHTVTITTLPYPTEYSKNYTGGSYPTTSVNDHVHTCNATSSAATALPAYTSTLYIERNASQGVVLGAEERSVPATPTIGTPQALSTTSIRWNFTDNASDETGFKVYDQMNNLVATCATPNISYCDETGLSPNIEYTRKIIAYNASGDSDFSSTATAYTLANVPSIFYGGNKTVNSIDISRQVYVEGITPPSSVKELYYDCLGTGCDTGLNSWTYSSTVTATGLEYNTGYDFQVKTRNGDNVETAYSESINLYTLATTPNITSDTVTETTISLTASDVRNLSAGSSGVYFECVDTDCDAGIKEWINTDTDVVTALSPNTEYTFKTKARNYDGTETAYSSEIDKYTLANVPTITAEAVGSSEIQLTVSNTANLGVDSSAVYFECTGASCNTGIGEWIGSTTDSVTGLQPDTQYTFRVKARNGDATETAYSDTVSVYTQSEVPKISSSVLSSSSIELTAGNIGTLGVGDSAVYFECTGDSCSTGLEEWIITDTDTVTGLSPNTEYTFRVKSRNYNGTETAYSDSITVYTYASVPTVTGSSPSSSSINVTANGVNNLGDGDSAVYFECITENCSEGVGEWITTDTDTVTTLSGNSMYSVRVKARNYDGIETAFSETTGIYTQAEVPTLTATILSSTSISLTAGNLNNINLGDSGLYFECTGDSCNEGLENWIQTDTDTVTELLPNTEYTFRVKARNYDGTETVYSDSITVYTYASVPTVTGSSLSSSSINITANGVNNLGDGDSAVYFECITENCSEGIGEWITTPTDAVTSLSGNSMYSIRVKARNYDGIETAFSEATEIYTQAEVPTVSASALSSSSISLTAGNITNIDLGDSGLYFECTGENCSEGLENWIQTDTDTVTELLPNTEYTFRVKARNYNNIQTDYSSNVSKYTLAETPEELELEAKTDTTVTLSMGEDINPDSTMYLIYDSVSDQYYNNSSNELSGTETWISKTDLEGNILVENLTAGTNYNFKIKARNGEDVETAYTSGISVYTNLLTPIPVTAQTDSSSAITWKFTDTNSTEIGFKVYDRAGNLVATCNEENITSCQETGLSPNSTYQRKIKAYNLNTESDFSVLSIATTYSEPSTITSITTVDGDTVTLNIDAGVNDVLQVYESTTNTYYDGDLEVLTSTSKNNEYSSAFVVDGLNPNSTYSFRIRSQNTSGIYTVWSEYINILTLPQVPTISSLNKLDVDTVRVFITTRTNPSTTQYMIQEVGSGQYIDYNTNTLVSGEVWGTFTQIGGVNGTLVNGLEGDSQYGFRVVARNSNNARSAYSQTQYIGTKSLLVNVPESLKATLVTNDDADLTVEANGQVGEQDVRIRQNDYLVADIPVSFIQDRDWGDVVLESAPQVYKTVVKLQDKHGITGPFTMYVSGGDTNGFRVCPGATNLNEITQGCEDEVKFTGEFPQTTEVEGNQVSVSKVILGGVKYWIADGLVGTGGEGFFVEDEENISENVGVETDSEEDVTFFNSISKPVKNISETSKQVVNGVVKALDDTPLKDLEEVELQTVVTTATAVTVAVGATTGLGGISQMVYLIGQFFSGILTALGLKRKRVSYGFVYDSYSKQPVSMVMIRLFDSEGNLVESSVTDSSGRFRGSLREGVYTLKISKRGYVFPTKFLKGIDDYPLPKIYKGGDFVISKGEDINLVIPIDSIDLTDKEKALAVGKGVLTALFSILTAVMFFLGIGVAIYMYDSYPTWQNLVISLIYVPSFIMIIRSFIKKSKKYGVVRDEKGKTISGIEIGLKELEFDTLIQKRISDDKGRYSFVVDEGNYQVVLLNDKFVLEEVKGGSKISVKKKDFLIKKKIIVKKK